MKFNFQSKTQIKDNYQSIQYGKILTVRLPCNPIFPIGPIYLADHIHKCFPEIKQQFIDLAIIPTNKVSKYLNSLDWSKPWNAGAQFAALCVFLETQEKESKNYQVLKDLN